MTPAGAPRYSLLMTMRVCVRPFKAAKVVGLRSEAFGTTQEFLRSKRQDGPKLFGSRCETSRSQRFGFSAPLVDAGFQIPIIFITGHGRYSHDGEGHEIRCGRIPDQALP